MLFLSPFLASLLILPAAVSSYRIDASCVGKGIDRDIRDGMTSAFSMVDSALRRLNQNPYDGETVNLIRRLFMPKNGQDPNNRAAMTKVKRIFENINTNYRLETTEPLQVTDIMIYCDDARFVFQGKRDKKLRKIYYDTTTNRQVLYKNQSCHGGIGEKVALAVTWNAQGKTEEWDEATQQLMINYEDRPTQIQICPWFIDWIKSKKYKFGNQVARSNIGRIVVNRAEGNLVLAQIDAFSLLDKVLLHEMTHGRAAFEGWLKINNEWERFEGTDDVNVPGYSFIPFMPFFGPRPAYGWKWARDLARLGPDINGLFRWDPNAPDHNADSIALFGSAAKLLDDQQWPRRVLDDGKIELIV